MAGKKTAAKKVAKNEKKVSDKDMQKSPTTGPVAAAGVIFVNAEKHARAKEIVDFVGGKRSTKTTEEEDRRERFAAIMSDNGVSAKDPDAVQFVYEKLGGLIRTPHEQEVADEQAQEARRKNKRNKIEADK